MFKHYLSTAWRNFLRFKLITSINVLGLTLGLACFFAAVGTMSVLSSADESLPNSDRVAMVWVRVMEPNTITRRPYLWITPEGVAASIAREFPEIEGVTWFNSSPNMPVVVGSRRVFLDGGVVDASFLNVLNLPRAQANSENPLATPRSVALSEAAARKLFDSTEVLGRTIRLRDKLDVTVTAVLKPLPRPTNLGESQGASAHYDMLFSFDTRAALIEAVTGKKPQPTPIEHQWHYHFGAATYVLLPKDGSLSFAQFESRLKGLAKRNGARGTEVEFRVVPLTKSFLARFDFNLLRDIPGLSIDGVLKFLAAIVLAVASANYAHLSFAQARARLRETGLRRSIGATRSQLAMQAFVEAICHISISVTLALTLTLILAAIVASRANTDVIELAFGNTEFWLMVILCIAIVTIVIAAYPAITLSRVKPVSAVQLSSRRSLGAQLLMGAQFVATGAFIVIALIAVLQNSAIRNKALQPDNDPLVQLGARWQMSGAGLDVWRTELLKSPAIRIVSASENPPWSDAFTLIGMRARDNADMFEAIAHDIGYDYDKAVDFKVLAGRAFDRRFGDIEKRSATPTAIVDESLSRRLEFAHPYDAVGKTLSIGDPPMTIVGVIEDKPMRLQPFMDSIGNVYFPDVRQRSMPIVRVDRTRVAEGLAHIDAVWKKLLPDEPISRYFADEVFQWSYFYSSLLGTVLTIGGCIALTVSLLGAFGFAVFASQQRAHEIGVRKTLGASAERILTMLLRDYSKPILIANILAWPFAYIAVQKYLSLYLERIDVTIIPFAASLIISLLVVWLAASRQAWRAARMNPATVLRHE